ncbi:sigma-70 family RNA polymerase sigma factor [Candidatus Clostridium radicumherbarum]|uniref:Sigma-70 family RNA polymerase sigma factor n=1 Tax=Candidatus Clostridium radicumherbarum TaxID=3381662 RepID=A0ABW8TQB9_9CLOT
MNQNEIEACVIRAKSGSQEDLLKILEQYKPFIFKTAKAFNIKNFDTYDLVQIAYVTIINVVLKYKIGSHTFTSYALNAIKNELKYTARKNSRYNQELSLNTPLNEADDNYNEFIDWLEAPETIEEELLKLEKSKELREALARLSEEELELVIMVYYNKVSIKTYAKKKGLAYTTAINRKNKILGKLKGLMVV